MMTQYRKIKVKYRDAILFFRLGDFYEMFEQDAKEASRLLDLTLTQRNGIPMCGIPYHAAQNYILRLLKSQKKIAICEQTSEPRPGKGIVDREVVEVITPGTIVDEDLLDQNENNYLAAIGKGEDTLSLAYIDLSTAEFYATSFPFSERRERLKRELQRLSPKEIIIQESILEEDNVLHTLLFECVDIVINRYPDWSYDFETNNTILKRQFAVANLKGFGLGDFSPEIPACGVIIDYISETSKSMLPHITSLTVYSEKSVVCLDESTQRNLELVRNLKDGSKKYTLLEILDHTRTSMGARRLKKWILSPLLDKNEIEQRLKIVDFLYRNQILLSNLRELLGKILDLERISAKIAMERAHAKDLLGVKSSLNYVLSIFELISSSPDMKQFWEPLQNKKETIEGLTQLLENTILEDPSLQLNEGNLIKPGYHAELDHLQDLKENARQVLEKLLEEEKKSAKISSLKLRYNRILGYFFEVTKSNLHLVPEHFIRRQSLVSSERFTTNELAEKETEINSASERIIDIEKDLFLEIRNRVKENISLLLIIAEQVSRLDVLQSFAFSATIHGFVNPVITNTGSLKITHGRHPVVEAHLADGTFIPNSIHLDMKSNLFILLTGPNMAGKSTFLRQVALIILMAQIGSFVPADDAVIGIVDKIFCRVGATDNLARGESTFLVEMNETANILRSATEKSFLILDEVGRGTSTNDGLSIAWAVTEYILKHIKAKTIFATHYHELTSLKHPKLFNLSMEVLEKSGEIIFLKRIKQGPADHSYGIHVARLAGLPLEVIERAQKILKELVQKTKQIENLEIKEDEKENQVQLFSTQDMVLRQIQSVQLNTMTPLDALNMISKWQKELGND
ncbi:MAG: DNA mismatch repair protein MutS [Spirochaetales bacterium]|nr:DNA mismatch repair protein MutS [Spirochaetales bacterium]